MVRTLLTLPLPRHPKKYVKHLNYLKIINKLLPQRRQTDSVFYELYTFTYEPASKQELYMSSQKDYNNFQGLTLIQHPETGSAFFVRKKRKFSFIQKFFHIKLNSSEKIFSKETFLT